MLFSSDEWLVIGLIFIWTGFVRTGLGFGGAALGLPLMLLVGQSLPIYWLPIIGIHLLFFSALSLSKGLDNVDWAYLKKTAIFILPLALLGVLGLISLPPPVIIAFIYSISIFYGFSWVFNRRITANKPWMDKMLLGFGGYIAGISLTGAPLIVAVFMRQIAKAQLRSTLFVLWFILVSMKMTTFIIFNIYIDWQVALFLLPVAAIGHFIGLKAHNKLLQNYHIFTKVIGFALIIVSLTGLFRLW